MEASPEDLNLIIKIVVRAASLMSLEQLGNDRLTTAMDLTACHENGCPLDLAGLLKANQTDFVHDVSGICTHINRKTGMLEGLFSPRFSAPWEREHVKVTHGQCKVCGHYGDDCRGGGSMRAALDTHFENHVSWQVWRAILDRVTANPHYRYEDPQKWPLLKMARFATQMMGKFNTLQWGPTSSIMLRPVGHGQEEDWQCRCGNHTNAEGFFPCDWQGNYVEPDAKWSGIYRCDRCGRLHRESKRQLKRGRLTNERRNEIVDAALVFTDLNDACKSIQDAIGVTDGGLASMFFSGRIYEDDKWAEEYGVEARRDLLTRYIRYELGEAA